jgi:hypothetical protein
MSSRHAESIETGINESGNSEEAQHDSSPSTRLERRRRIEDLFEEKRLREECGEFDLT